MTSPFLAVSDQQAMDSIRQQLGQSVDTSMIIWAAVAVALVVGVIIYFNQRMKKKAEGLNHMGKLMKEISQEVGLKPADIKRIKEMSARMDEPVRKNPMVLLLCPSLLSKAMKKKQ